MHYLYIFNEPIRNVAHKNKFHMLLYIIWPYYLHVNCQFNSYNRRIHVNIYTDLHGDRTRELQFKYYNCITHVIDVENY